MKTLHFVTTNDGKVREAEAYFDEYEVRKLAYDYNELQGELSAIVRHGLNEAYDHVRSPVIIEDSGLFIDALGGFPGPYSSYVEDTLGIERVAELTLNENDRAAHFRSVVGYRDRSTVRLFDGSVTGRIVEPRGSGGFAYDPIVEVDGQTMAERTTEEKNSLSHRGRALQSLREWLET